MSERNRVVLSTQAYGYLAQRICDAGGFSTVEVEVRDFPDGERYHRIASDVEGQDAVLVGGTISAGDIPRLREIGYGVFPTGSRLSAIVAHIRTEVVTRRQTSAAG